MAHPDVVGLPATIDHFEVQHFYIAAPRKQANGREAAFAATDTHCVAFRPETDLLASQLHPVAIAAATAIVVPVSSLRGGVGRESTRQHQRAGQRRRHLSQIHRHLPDYGATAPPHTMRQLSAAIAARKWPTFVDLANAG